MRNLVVKSFFAALFVSLLSSVAVAQTGGLAADDPILIERVSVLNQWQLAFEAGTAFELDREFGGAEYDNIRVAPLGARFGLGDGTEVGVSLAFNSNDAEDDFAPDDSGLEGLTLYGKLALNEYAAIKAGLTVLGEDDVAPYPNDGVDVFVNLALQRPLGPGKLFGELGHTSQGGDFDISSYTNYGVGYGLPLSDMIGLSVELIGEEAHAGTGANTLQLVGGANILLMPNMLLAPYLGIGINDASPDVAVGAKFEFRL